VGYLTSNVTSVETKSPASSQISQDSNTVNMYRIILQYAMMVELLEDDSHAMVIGEKIEGKLSRPRGIIVVPKGKLIS
jgi:hypothetical protein